MTYTTTQNLLPRRQIGPDALKYLRDISKHTTGDRFAFDGCRVQRNHTGMPAKEIDVAALEEVGSKHPDSYGVFIKRFVIPEAEMLAHYLSGMTEEDRKARLSILLRKAHSRDATAWWLLSTASLRSMLFPGAYTDGRRSGQRGLSRQTQGLPPGQSGHSRQPHPGVRCPLHRIRHEDDRAGV